AQTAVVNAYLAPIMEQYLQAVSNALPEDSLRVMTSAGGLVVKSHFQAKDSLLSGPAGGIVGAAWAAKEAGITRILTLDMGGTSTDVARYDGSYHYRYQVKVGHAELLSPALAIETVAAGGGSICRFDGAKLEVGPESAGASPGPACYGAGGPLTITDVNLLLGHLDPSAFPVPISVEAAQEALAKLRGDHAFREADLLQGFYRIANEKMAAAVRNISVRQGYHPPEYALLSFGGAAGQHACAVADLLGIERVLIPYEASILSARGMGQAQIERFATRQVLQAFREAADHIPALIEDLKNEALAALAEESLPGAKAQIETVWLYLRLKGQDHSLPIKYAEGEDVIIRFRNEYENVFGHWMEGREIELASIRVNAVLRQVEEKKQATLSESYEPQPFGQRQDFAQYHWEELGAGATITGPALLQSQFTTIVLPAHWAIRLDHNLAAVLERKTETKTPSLSEHQDLDPVQLELFMHRFQSIAEEMGALLERTSFSVNVKERLDFSCALLDANGYLVVNAPHIPVHLGSLGV
ncbi:MAG: hydantoinase/oxoprolinase family protein, partial [Bacteroidota bacterium]